MRIWHYPGQPKLLSIATRAVPEETEHLQLLQQVHSSDFVECPGQCPDVFPDAFFGTEHTGDAWLWREAPQKPLGIYTADCVPAFLFDPHSDAGALLHLGRRGIEGGLLPKVAQALSGHSLSLILGPAIGPCCYEVPISMAQKFCHSVGCDCLVLREGHCFLDLRRAVIEQARDLHLEYICPDCTSCEARKYIANPEAEAPCYSYRQGHKTQRIYTIFDA